MSAVPITTNSYRRKPIKDSQSNIQEDKESEDTQNQSGWHS